MNSYLVFGGHLRSEVSFPDLSPEASDVADWEFQIARALPESPAEQLVGAHTLGSFEAQLYEGAAHLRLRLHGLGDCLISDRGRKLTWVGEESATPELVRAVVLGPALGIALQQAGTLCLHASAVEIGGTAIAFLGPKNYGKSTIAMALVQGGARLVTDDALAIDVEPVVMARPGVHSLRLREDTASEFASGPVRPNVVDGLKKTLVGFPRDAVIWERSPLGAVYVLAPAEATASRGAVRRHRLTPVEATLELALHGKLPDPLIGLKAVGDRLRQLGAVVRTVAVYSLHVPRDLRLMEKVVDQVFGWNGARRGGDIALSTSPDS